MEGLFYSRPRARAFSHYPLKPRGLSFLKFPLRVGRPFLVRIQERGKEDPFVRGDFDSPLTRRYQRFNKIQRKCFCAYPLLNAKGLPPF